LLPGSFPSWLFFQKGKKRKKEEKKFRKEARGKSSNPKILDRAYLSPRRKNPVAINGHGISSFRFRKKLTALS